MRAAPGALRALRPAGGRKYARPPCLPPCAPTAAIPTRAPRPGAEDPAHWRRDDDVTMGGTPNSIPLRWADRGCFRPLCFAVAPPLVTAIFPTTGNVLGGEMVEIGVDNFRPAKSYACNFDRITVVSLSLSRTSLSSAEPSSPPFSIRLQAMTMINEGFSACHHRTPRVPSTSKLGWKGYFLLRAVSSSATNPLCSIRCTLREDLRGERFQSHSRVQTSKISTIVDTCVTCPPLPPCRFPSSLLPREPPVGLCYPRADPEP